VLGGDIYHRLAWIYYLARSRIAYAVPTSILKVDTWHIIESDLGKIHLGLFYPNQKTIEKVSYIIKRLIKEQGYLPLEILSLIDLETYQAVKYGHVTLDPINLVSKLISTLPRLQDLKRRNIDQLDLELEDELSRLLASTWFYTFHEYAPLSTAYLKDLNIEINSNLLIMEFNFIRSPDIKFRYVFSILGRTILSFKLESSLSNTKLIIYPLYI